MALVKEYERLKGQGKVRKVINAFLDEYDKEPKNYSIDWAGILSYRLAKLGVVIKIENQNDLIYILKNSCPIVAVESLIKEE